MIWIWYRKFKAAKFNLSLSAGFSGLNEKKTNEVSFSWLNAAGNANSASFAFGLQGKKEILTAGMKNLIILFIEWVGLIHQTNEFNGCGSGFIQHSSRRESLEWYRIPNAARLSYFLLLCCWFSEKLNLLVERREWSRPEMKLGIVSFPKTNQEWSESGLIHRIT